MDKTITIFLPFSGTGEAAATLKEFHACYSQLRIVLVTEGKTPAPEGYASINVGSPHSSEAFAKIAEHTATDFALLVLQETQIELGQFCLERFMSVAAASGAAVTYADYYDVTESGRTPHPVIAYQEGSVRDDFNFGALVLLRADLLRACVAEMKNSGSFSHAGWYALRLSLSRHGSVVRIGEKLYANHEPDRRRSGEKQFDYVNPKNRAVQIEMEQACTDHLKAVGAYLAPSFHDVDIDVAGFPVEASVIIPVRNRVTTIGEAIASVLRQKADFAFNCFVVDNHSTDGTSDIVARVAATDKRVMHCIPARDDLGIGGCWNYAVHHASCGKYSVQLDSDDVYKDESTLRRIVETFRRERCAMVVGTYQMTDFQLNEIPPGIIDHREWTPENGRNNALRINGLGAPRAFYTPVLRSVNIPNVSYGEDYAVGLTISRHFRIGRVYEPIYLCRRWEGNSDANLDVSRKNEYDLYKDFLRTVELLARKQGNAHDRSGMRSAR